MNCEICSKNPATVHYTVYENNQTREMHVCQGCAQEKGIVVVSPDEESASISNPIIALFGDAGVVETPGARVRCSGCGLLYSEFRSTGRLGCADCYESFAAQLRPLLRRIHGDQSHSGKAPQRGAGLEDRRNRLQTLQAEMELAISRENFERAAEIRDRIRTLRTEDEGE